MYYYEIDRNILIANQLNEKLEVFEKNQPYTAGKTFYKFKSYPEYCARRFRNREERLNCRVVTNTMKSYAADFCTRRIYSEKPILFEYNLVNKYTCLKQRLGDAQYIHHEIQENIIDRCMVEGHPLLVI
jgi:hypothetical protein